MRFKVAETLIEFCLLLTFFISGNRPTPESIAEYSATFGDDYFSFWHNGVHFIVINSQFYEDSSLTKDLAEKQDLWLAEMLEVTQK